MAQCMALLGAGVRTRESAHSLGSNAGVDAACQLKGCTEVTLCIMSNQSFCFTSKYAAIWKENLVVNQTSLKAFFYVLLQLRLLF